jgi:hypothetical protein
MALLPTPKKPPEVDLTREDQSVSNRVNDLISGDSTFIQRARTDARKESSRRGLLNSSIGIQAGEEAAQKAALPIASQEASQIAQQNLQRERFGQETSENIARRAFEQREAALGRQLTRGESELGRQLTREEGAAERTARAGLLQEELASTEREGAANRGLQRYSVDARIEADQLLQESGIIANKDIALLDADTRVEISQLSRDSQEAIAALNVQGAARRDAIQAAVSFAQVYENTFLGITSNDEIPADYRDVVLEHLGLIRDSNLAMIAQIHNVDLEWLSPISVPGQESSAAASGSLFKNLSKTFNQ